MGFLRSLKGTRRLTSVLMALVAVAAIGAGVAGQASAGNSGQTGIWGQQGTAPGHLSTPTLFAAEENGSVFIGDRPDGPGSLRLQKFSATGALEGSAKILTPSGEKFVAMAVDSSAHRIYLLRAKPESDVETGAAMAEEIVVLSTIPNPTTQVMEAPAGGPLPVPTDAEGAIDNPIEMALDPHSGELEIAGENRAGKFVLQRIGTANGAAGPRYAETSGSFGLNAARGIKGALAIGADGTSYIVWTNANLENKARTLPENLSTPTVLTGFAEALEQIKISRSVANERDGTGQQIAISPDGSTLYFKTALFVEQEAGGNILVFAYSLADEHAFAIYGGKEEEDHCTIQSVQAALAPVGESLFVLDQGNEQVPSPFGAKVIRFGPGGSECPAPSAAFALKVGSSRVTQVPKGTTVALDASASEPGEWGESIESVTWKVKGPGPAFEETVPFTEPSSLILHHPFTEEGSYTVQMSMKMANPSTKLLPFDAKPQTLTVNAPGAGLPPTVTEVSPNHGPAAGSTTVTIKGTEFTGASAVKFGGVAATDLNVIGTEELTAKAPTGTQGSAVDVTVTTPEGTSAKGAADKYTYDSVLEVLSVTKAGTGAGTVISSPNGISCGSVCSGSFTQNQAVSLTATPDSGSTFAGWSGACTGTSSCVVPMSAAQSVVATFTAATGGEEPKPKPIATPSPGPGPGPGTTPTKTKAQELAEKRQKALKKCKKLSGKAKAQCIKKANQIGKPKPKKSKK